MLAKPGAIVTRSETADVPPTEGCAELKHGVVLVMLTKPGTTMTQMQVMQEPERVARPCQAQREEGKSQ